MAGVSGLLSSCKHVFAILHYIQIEVTLGPNETSTSKKQKWDAIIYRKSKKVHPPTELVIVAKPHAEYECDEIPKSLSRKRSRFHHRLSHNSDISFRQKDWEELAKAIESTVSVLQFIPTIFSSTSFITPILSCSPTIWGTVSN